MLAPARFLRTLVPASSLMKKTFSTLHPRKAPARVVDTIKHDIRNYVQRERRKPLPEGFDRLEFVCKVGPNAAAAEVTALPMMSRMIDSVVAGGSTDVYVEILPQPTARPERGGPRA